jgi:orotate phosphoribosyltransferase
MTPNGVCEPCSTSHTPPFALKTPTFLFQSGLFTLASGATSRWKIECDAISPLEWKTLALMASEILPPFGAVEGVPRGGIPFAEALAAYVTEGPLLIAEDVVTTGGSMERYRNGRDAIGVSVFSRGQHPGWVTPLFVMNQWR